MKVVNKKDFLNLPENTIFSKGKVWCFDGLSMKGESFSNDFFYLDLIDMDMGSGSNEYFERLDDSLINGNSYPINDAESRDGMFLEDEVFLIFENDDILTLIENLKKGLK